MKKTVTSVIPLLFIATLIYCMITEEWLWARALGGVAVIYVFLWTWRNYRGVSTILWCLVAIANLGAGLWLRPAGIIGDSLIILLTCLAVVSSVWEIYRQRTAKP